QGIRGLAEEPPEGLELRLDRCEIPCEVLRRGEPCGNCSGLSCCAIFYRFSSRYRRGIRWRALDFVHGRYHLESCRGAPEAVFLPGGVPDLYGVLLARNTGYVSDFSENPEGLFSAGNRDYDDHRERGSNCRRRACRSAFG